MAPKSLNMAGIVHQRSAAVVGTRRTLFPTVRGVFRKRSSAARGMRKRLLQHHDNASVFGDDWAVRVLVVEDEVRLASLIRKGLRAEGLLADVAIKGEDALWMAASSPYDVLTLDLGLSGMDGLEVCRCLRADRVRTPILMLTAREAVEYRIAGLDAGADDYLVKPFDFGELLARLRALARRGPAEHGTVLRVADLALEPASRRVRRGDREVELSTKEFQLLEVFMRHPDQVLTRYQLLERAWDAAYEHRSNVIDVYVRYLREKLDRPFGVESIETVRGTGYRLRAA
jgi:two-component system OmpR family response regulator